MSLDEGPYFIFASTAQQFELACRQLGLNPRRQRFVWTARDLEGVDIGRVIQVEPVLSFDDRWRDVYELLCHRVRLTGKRPLMVVDT